MARLLISALAMSATNNTPESAHVTLSVSIAETGEPVVDIRATDVQIWDAYEKAQIHHFHSLKNGLYTLFADWQDRRMVGKVTVNGIFVKIKRLRGDAHSDYGQALARLSVIPD
jgi:hypothetical protein